MTDKNTGSSLSTPEDQDLPENHVQPVPLMAANDDPPDETVSKEPEPPDTETELKRLADLPDIDYYRCRADAAKLLGIPALALDKLIKPYKSTAEPNSSTEMFPIVPPWDDPVDGEQLLNDIVNFIALFIVCELHVAQTTALWIMFTWCIEVMKNAPIACITAPEKRCGKTQLLTLMSRLSLKPLQTSNITAPALFRSIEKWKPTLFIDEADAFLKQNEEMRGVLNAGFEADGCVIRTVGEDFTPTSFNVFSAKAISGIGHLPDTLKDRSILLELRRKRPDETRERLRHADKAEFEEFKRKLARWAEDNMEALRVARPELPTVLNDRAQDCWEPLLAIADQVGGDWSKIARKAALAISGTDEQTPSVNEQLLANIKQVIAVVSESSISTTQLLAGLCSDDEAPWATWNKGKPMTPRQLSARLGDFGIASKQIRLGTRTMKGYELGGFTDVFTRYLVNTESEPADISVTPKQGNDYKDLY